MLAVAASPLRNASYASRFVVGRASSPARTLSASATPSASATLVAMSAWTSKTLVSEASNCWPQRVPLGLSRPCLHQLGAHPHPARRPRGLLPPHRSGQQVVRAQLPRDLGRGASSSPGTGSSCPARSPRAPTPGSAWSAPRRPRRRRSRRRRSRPGSRTGAPRRRGRRRRRPRRGGCAARRTARRRR